MPEDMYGVYGDTYGKHSTRYISFLHTVTLVQDVQIYMAMVLTYACCMVPISL